jgi:hypothetical protein
MPLQRRSRVDRITDNVMNAVAIQLDTRMELARIHSLAAQLLTNHNVHAHEHLLALQGTISHIMDPNTLHTQNSVRMLCNELAYHGMHLEANGILQLPQQVYDTMRKLWNDVTNTMMGTTEPGMFTNKDADALDSDNMEDALDSDNMENVSGRWENASHSQSPGSVRSSASSGSSTSSGSATSSGSSDSSSQTPSPSYKPGKDNKQEAQNVAQEELMICT